MDGVESNRKNKNKNDKSIKIEVVENKRDEMMVLKIGFDVWWPVKSINMINHHSMENIFIFFNGEVAALTNGFIWESENGLKAISNWWNS